MRTLRPRARGTAGFATPCPKTYCRPLARAREERPGYIVYIVNSFGSPLAPRAWSGLAYSANLPNWPALARVRVEAPLQDVILRLDPTPRPRARGGPSCCTRTAPHLAPDLHIRVRSGAAILSTVTEIQPRGRSAGSHKRAVWRLWKIRGGLWCGAPAGDWHIMRQRAGGINPRFAPRRAGCSTPQKLWDFRGCARAALCATLHRARASCSRVVNRARPRDQNPRNAKPAEAAGLHSPV